MKNYPLLSKWFRRSLQWDKLFPWCERQTALAWQSIVGWLLEAQRRAPRCLKRQRVQLAIEGLERRDLLSAFAFSAATYTVAENAGSATITVSLDSAPSQTVTVDYATSDGTAVAGTNYTTTSGTLTFLTTDPLSKTFSVPVLDDFNYDSGTFANLTLSNATGGATLGSPSTATLTISNTDLSAFTEYAIPTANSRPWEIAKGPDGNLWFTEHSANQIAKVTTSGTFTEYAIPTSGSAPDGIVTGPDGNVWFTELGGNTIGKITTSGTITEYTLPNSGSGPDIIVVGPDGNLWFNEISADRIGKITTSGTITEYTLPNSGSVPSGITVGPDGNFWFTEAGGNNIGTVTSTGTFTEYAIPTPNSGTWEITTGGDGNLWFTEQSVNKIGRITTGGAITEFTVPTASSGPLGIAEGPDANIYFAENSTNKLGRITPSGQFTEWVIPTSSSGPWSVTGGPDGNVWLTENSANQVAKFWGTTGQVHGGSDDPWGGQLYGPGSDQVALATGTVLLSHPLNLNANQQATVLGGAPAFIYNGRTVSVQPIVEGIFSSDSTAGVPTLLKARLTWNGGTPGSWVTFGTSGHSAGDIYDLAFQVSPAVTATGYYSWTIDVQVTYPGNLAISRSASGYTAVVVQGTTDPFGAGWSLAGLDSIISVTGGVLLLHGSGGAASFFSSLGSGNFLSPPDDFGTLTQNQVNSTYLYVARNKLKYNFDSGGKLTTIVDPHSLTRTFLYDGSNRLTGIKDPDGTTATLTYSGSYLSKIDAPGSRTVTTTINGSGDLVNIANPDNGVRTLTYDSGHRVTSDQLSPLSTAFAYDSGNHTLTTLTWGSSNYKIQAADVPGLATAPAVSTSQATAVVTDPRSYAYTYTLDGQDRATQLVEPDGSASGIQTMTWSRDFAEEPTSIVDPRNLTTGETWVNGDMTGINHADGTSEAFAYNSFDRLTSFTDQNGNKTTSGYDATTGDLLTTTDALNKTTTNTWSNGLLQTVKDANGNVTSFSYDSFRRVQLVTNALSGKTTMLYDGAGNTTGVVDPLSRMVTSAFDGMGRVTSVTRPGNLTRTTLYNAAGLVTDQKDENNNETQFAYDSRGLLTTTSEAVGTSVARTTTNSYDLAGNTTQVTDPRGKNTKYQFDSLNRATVITDPLNNLTTKLFDKDGNVTQITDPLSRVTKFQFDAANRATLTTDPMGKSITTLFDKAGNVTEVINQASNFVKTGFDADERQNSTTDGAGNVTTKYFDAAGNVTGVQDGNGKWTTFLYDALNRQSVTIDADSNRVTTLFDAASQVTGTINANGWLTQYFPDAAGRVTVTVNALSGRTTTLFDKVGNITETFDANNHPTTFAFDALNRQTGSTDALSHSSSTYYDANGNVTQSTDANGHITQYQFDDANRLTVTIAAAGTSIAATTTKLYDAAGQVTQITNPNGKNTQFIYDSDGRQSVTIDALTNRTTTLFDQAGNVTGVINARTYLTQYLIDANNRASVTIDALTHRTTSVYDGAGRVTGVTDPASVTLGYNYDAAGRLTQTTGGPSGTINNYYDAAGNVTGVKDGNNNLTQYAFDKLNRLTLTTDPRNFQTARLYDAVGNLTQLQDARTNVTTSGFDAANRMISQTQTDLAGAHTATFAYDAIGQLTGRTDRLARVSGWQYDALNRLTVQTGGASPMTATYDAVGNMLTAQSAAGNYTMTYDALNRVTLVSEPFGQGLTLTYDAVGNRTQIVDSKGGIETSVYDADNRLQARYFAGISTPQFHIDLTYLDNGLLSTEVRYSLLGGPSSPIGRTTLLYDGANRVTSIKHADSGGSTGLVTLAYNYDSGGRLTSEVDNGATRSYTYTVDNQLLADGTNTYTYDGTGNRNNTGWSAPAGNNNELQTDPTWTYSYDAEGNETKKSKGASAETWTYGYDNLDHLIWAKQAPTDGGAVVQEVDFKYDWFGNRVQKDVIVGGTTTTQRFALDGWDPAKSAGQGTSNWDVWADLDGSNNLTMRYLRGDVVDQVFARVAWNGVTATPAWLLTDHLGSVVGVTDNTGALNDRITYDGWGNLATETDATHTLLGRYRWTGREVDTEINLQYNRARFYDPNTSRWMSQDPLRFNAGDSNLYRYVFNKPTTFSDPSGLFAAPQTPVDGGGSQAGDVTFAVKWTAPKEFQVPTIPLGPLAKVKGKGTYNFVGSITTNPKAPTRGKLNGNVQVEWQTSFGIDYDTKYFNALIPPGLPKLPEDKVELAAFAGLKLTVTGNLSAQGEIKNGKFEGTVEGRLTVTVSGGVKGKALIKTPRWLPDLEGSIEAVIYGQGSVKLGGGFSADFKDGISNFEIKGLVIAEGSVKAGGNVKVNLPILPQFSFDETLWSWKYPP
jgi:RHS repeat-associated protein